VNMQDFNETTNSFVGLIGDGTDTVDESTSPNFRSYHLESKTFTDTFPDADVLPYGKPRVAIEKFEPTRVGNFSISQGSSNLFRRYSSLKFSDRSNSNSNIVRYTSFNDSKLPFKDLQNNDGAVFFLLNQNDSIFCIQRLKCSSIPVARNILSDALGNETVIATSKVLGTEKYYAGAYGTDSAPSVAQAGNSIYFVSIRNKEVYRFNPNSGIEIISDKGMGSFFNEALAGAELGAVRVVGGYDPDSDEFVLSINEDVLGLSADFSGIPFSNEVSIVVADDYTGFEADTGSGTDSGVDPVLNAEAIQDLTNQIGSLVQFIFDNETTIASLGNDVSTIDDLLATDFTQIAFEGGTVEVNIGAGPDIIGPSPIPQTYIDALQAIRSEVISNIAQLMESNISSLVSLGDTRYDLVDLFARSGGLTREVAETLSEFQIAITALQNSGFDVVDAGFITQDELDQISQFSDFDDANFLDVLFNTLSFPDNSAVITTNEVFPSLQDLFGDVIDLTEFSIIEESVTVPGILPLAFVTDQAFSDYVLDVQAASPFFNSANLPDISDLAQNIFAAIFKQAQDTIEDIETENEADVEAAYQQGFVAGQADGFDAGYDDGYDDGNNVAVNNFSNQIASLNEDLALSEKRLQIITKSLFVLANAIELSNDPSQDEIANSFGASVSEFVSIAEANDQDLINSIDEAYQSLTGGSPTEALLPILQLYGSGSDSPFISLMSSAVDLANGAIPDKSAVNEVANFMTGNSDFLASGGVDQNNISSASLEGAENRTRLEALRSIAQHIGGGAFSAISFAGSGAASATGMSPGLLAEFLSAWIQIGQAINQEVPDTIHLTPTNPQGLVDANQTFTLTGDNGEPVGSITFDQLVNIFRKGLISENQAKLIFKGLMGPKSSGGVSAYTSSNTIHAFDSNFDNEIGSADLLDFLIVFGREAVQEQNFQQFGNVEFTGENLASGYAEVVPIPNTSDSAPFLEDDVDAINIQGL
jgi:hypothetical protein